MIGCTNNNYASREKCKKCGQPKEVAAMPAIAIPGASLPTHPNYFARAQAGLEQTVNLGLLGNGGVQQFFTLGSSLSSSGADRFGISSWSVGATNNSGNLHASLANQLVTAPEGWQNGDWICTCGFHNYSSRGQCKKCNAPVPAAVPSSTAFGTKRLASEELAHEWDSKRLNAGQTSGLQQTNSGQESVVGSSASLPAFLYSNFPSGYSALTPNLQFNLPMRPPAPNLLGKGAKQWRDGDWMCSHCNNHNYASRSECNRCKAQREVLVQPVSVA